MNKEVLRCEGRPRYAANSFSVEDGVEIYRYEVGATVLRTDPVGNH